MRLVCPNCEAKYEVPEDAIPETGRDVQCANCGHAWYQMRSRAPVADAPVVAAPSAAASAAVAEPEPVPAPEPEPEPEPEPVAPELEVTAEAVAPPPEVPAPDMPEPEPSVPEAPAAEVSAPEPAVEAVVEAVPEAAAAVEAVAEVDETATGDLGQVQDESPAVSDDPVADATIAGDAAVVGDAPDEAPGAEQLAAAAAAAAPVAYAVDESVLAILREEAEREAHARRAEGAKPLEVQTDLGIDAAVPVAKKPVEVISVDAAPAAPAEDADDKSGPRRTRLPDVEEINSTLRPSEQEAEEAAGAVAPLVAEGRSSFRSGFLLVMTIAILGAALYISADALAGAIPALAGVLDGYVGFVDSLRLQLDGLMQSATVAINGSGS